MLSGNESQCLRGWGREETRLPKKVFVVSSSSHRRQNAPEETPTATYSFPLGPRVSESCPLHAFPAHTHSPITATIVLEQQQRRYSEDGLQPLGQYLLEFKSQSQMYTHVCGIVRSPQTVQTRPQGPPVGECMNRMGCIHTVEYYSAMKKGWGTNSSHIPQPRRQRPLSTHSPRHAWGHLGTESSATLQAPPPIPQGTPNTAPATS